MEGEHDDDLKSLRFRNELKFLLNLAASPERRCSCRWSIRLYTLRYLPPSCHKQPACRFMLVARHLIGTTAFRFLGKLFIVAEEIVETSNF